MAGNISLKKEGKSPEKNGGKYFFLNGRKSSIKKFGVTFSKKMGEKEKRKMAGNLEKNGRKYKF